MTSFPADVTPLVPATVGRRCRADRALQVADVLRTQVLHGLVRDGTLPAEAGLAREFGVSRNTVRHALDLLREEGLVERVPGVGTLVSGTKFRHGLDELRGLQETLRDHGEVRNEIRVSGLVPAPTGVARRLGSEPSEPVVYFERRRLVDGLPLSLDLTYVPRDLGEPLLEENLEGEDVFVLLEEISGQPLGTADLSLEAIAADPHTAAILDVSSGSPLLMVERLTSLADGRPVDLEFIRFRGDRISMRGTTRRTSPVTADPKERAR
ncbi:GntR family transcriptional regulator [Nocardioides sp. Soil797]|nr:GntR family transcriptional regulator [Nocardioides sp. Soil797]